MKQKLLERKTCTPKSTPHAPGPVTLCLNSSKAAGTVMQSSKTSNNTPEEALTPKAQGGQDLRVPVIYVLNMRGNPLMPTSPRKARVLLKKGEARVIKRTPLTIQLTKPTGEAKQSITLGVDAGYSHVGLSAVAQNKELLSSEVNLRTDMVKLNSERRQYRRTRRSRKTWYRQPRFLNRVKSKPKGWLAPSIQHKLDTHIKLVKNTLNMLPVSNIIVEVGNFDIQKIQNPGIESKDYQEGAQLGFYNVREYVFHRDHHTCLHCKSQNVALVVHHIKSRQTGGDRPNNLITLCKKCHDDHHKGVIKLKVKKSKPFRAATFMSTIKWKLLEELKDLGLPVTSTYGYITKSNRIELGLSKSHSNDAFVIAGGTDQVRSDSYLVKQVRKQNRKLFKGIRSHIRNTASRIVKGFQRYDKVLYNKVECFIFGRRRTGYFDVRKLNGEAMNHSVSYKKLKLLENFGTLLSTIK